jgi:cell division protein FtsB
MIFLLQLSITAIALFVTYTSVLGLGALFATIAYPIMAAGVALELGKYVAVSYAYQRWTVIAYVERTLLAFFITLMMAFTSAGVFSYLGQSYQVSYATLDSRKTELAALTVQAEGVSKRVAAIEAQISNLPSNVVTGRIRLMREYEAERTPLVAQLNQMNAKVAELTQTVANAEVHAGPITYIARATGTTVEQSATWIILALTICLDPFALFLTVLMNKLLLLKAKRKDEALHFLPRASDLPSVSMPVVPEPIQASVEPPAPEVEVAAPIIAEQAPAVLQASTLDKVLAAKKKPAAKKPAAKKPATKKTPAKPAAKRVRKKPEPKTLPKVDLPAATLTKPVKPQVNEV